MCRWSATKICVSGRCLFGIAVQVKSLVKPAEILEIKTCETISEVTIQQFKKKTQLSSHTEILTLILNMSYAGKCTFRFEFTLHETTEGVTRN